MKSELNKFFETQQGKRLVSSAKELLKYNPSEAMIEARLWTSRAQNVGIRHIKRAIEEAKS